VPSTQLGTLLTNPSNKPTNVVPNRVGTYDARHIVLLSVCLNDSILNGPSITHQRTDGRRHRQQHDTIILRYIIVSQVLQEYKTPNVYIQHNTVNNIPKALELLYR